MPNFSFDKLSVEEQDKVIKGHGKYVAACGHTIANCWCAEEHIEIPVYVMCVKCDPTKTLEDMYNVRTALLKGFKKEALFNRKKPTEEPASIAVMDQPSFEQYIQSLNIEPIEDVRKRFESVKDINEYRKYYDSGKQDEDFNRLQFETGIVKTPTGQIIVQKNPEQIRNTNRSLVLDTYGKYEKGKGLDLPGKMYKLFASRVASLSLLVTDEKASLYLNRVASELCRIAAEELSNERKTTKGEPAIAIMIRRLGQKETIADFMETLNEKAKPSKEDTWKDIYVKKVYRAFLSDLMKNSIDTVEEISATNKPADELIAEIDAAKEPTQALLDKIEKYGKKF